MSVRIPATVEQLQRIWREIDRLRALVYIDGLEWPSLEEELAPREANARPRACE